MRNVKKTKYGRSKTEAMNAEAASLMNYGGVMKLRKDELERIGKKTKLMTVWKEFHQRSDVARLYVGRKKGVSGLMGWKDEVESKRNKLVQYLEKECTEALYAVPRSRCLKYLH